MTEAVTTSRRSSTFRSFSRLLVVVLGAAALCFPIGRVAAADPSITNVSASRHPVRQCDRDLDHGCGD